MHTEPLIREFRYNGVRLADPSPTFSLQQVRDFYGNTYPEIVNAEIEGPEVTGNRNVFTFRRAVGTKGNALSIEELRVKLQEGTFRTNAENLITPSAASSDVVQKLDRAVNRIAKGVRLQVPATQMPVLP